MKYHALLGGLLFASAAHAFTVPLNVQHVTCGSPNSGSVSVGFISDGVPPYTYLWNTGSTASSITNLGVGSYSVTVTDALGGTGSASATVGGSGGPLTVYPKPVTCTPEGYRFFGNSNVTGPGPYQFSDNGYSMSLYTSADPFNDPVLYFSLWDDQLAPGTPFTATFTDGNGCPGTVGGVIPSPQVVPVPQVLDVQGSCGGAATGEVILQLPATSNGWVYAIWTGLLGTPASGWDYVRHPPSWDPVLYGPGATTAVLPELGPGTYGLLMRPRPADPYFTWVYDEYYPDYAECTDTIWVTVPDLGYTCGQVYGVASMDDNMSCTGPDPVRVSGSVMLIEPGGYYALTDAQGKYKATLPYGSYTVEQLSSVVAEHCAGAPQPFTLSMWSVSVARNFPDTALLPTDVTVYGAQGPARPGFPTSIALNAKNLSVGVTGAVTLTLAFDPLLAYTSAVPAPASVTGNTITWNLPQLTSFGSRQVSATFDVPPDVTLLGTVLAHTATVGIAQPEQDLTNNTVTVQREITGAYDPNRKTALTNASHSSSSYVLDEDAWIDYTIEFQNTGTDTAFNVLITDTLPAFLDPGTFEAGASSHHNQANLSGQGTLSFNFQGILLPESNINEPASHGFVSFRIKPKGPLLPGTTIENSANIYFDFNPPVITDASVLTVEIGSGVPEAGMGSLTLSPNPADDRLAVQAERPLGRLEVWALDGRLLLRRTVQASSAELAVEALPPGMYVIRSVMAPDEVRHQRFIKR